jgi:type II secretory pathway component PulC
VAVPTPDRPVARLIVLNNSSGTAVVEAHEVFPGDSVDLATQLHDMAEAIRSRIQGLSVDRTVVRRADRPPKPNNNEGPRLRLIVEGAVISAARSVVVETRAGTGKDTGMWFGSNKAGVDAAATALLTSNSLPANLLEATSAALAGLALP